MGLRPIRNLRIPWLGWSAIVFSLEHEAAGRVDPVRPDRVPDWTAAEADRALGPHLSPNPPLGRVAGGEPGSASLRHAFPLSCPWPASAPSRRLEAVLVGCDLRVTRGTSASEGT